jgi:hypothetical protein
VTEHIPWGTELRREAHWVGPNGRLRLASFRIENAGGAPPGRDQIVLEIAANAENGALLRNVLRFLHYGHWRFPDGARALVSYQRQIERWSDEIVAALRPDAAALETAIEDLLVGGRILGLDDGQDDEASLIEAMLKPAPNAAPNEMRSKEWLALASAAGEDGARTTAKRSELMAFVLASASAAQGTGRPLALDAARVLPVVRPLAKRWQLEPRSGLPNSLQRHHDRLLSAFDPALESESRTLESWSAKATSALGEDSYEQAARAVLAAAQAATELGKFRPAGTEEQLRDAAKSLVATETSVQQTIAAIRDLPDASSGARLAALARDRTAVMSVVTTFLDKSERFLDQTSQAVEREVESVVGGQEPGDSEQLVACLHQLAELLSEVAQLSVREREEAAS